MQRRVGLELDRDRPDERVRLVAGVLAGRVAQLAQERLLHGLELFEVGFAELDHEVVGRDGSPPHPDRALEIHLAHEAPAQLDGAHAAAEHPREHPFDHALESVFEVAQAHAVHVSQQTDGPIRHIWR